MPVFTKKIPTTIPVRITLPSGDSFYALISQIEKREEGGLTDWTLIGKPDRPQLDNVKCEIHCQIEPKDFQKLEQLADVSTLSDPQERSS